MIMRWHRPACVLPGKAFSAWCRDREVIRNHRPQTIATCNRYMLDLQLVYARSFVKMSGRLAYASAH